MNNLLLYRFGGVILEVFAGADGATWTIVVSNAEGKSCLLSAGTDWQWHSASPAAPAPLSASADGSWQ